MSKSTKQTYTCRGNVRGSCGIHHTKLSGALRCLERDQSGCQSQGGYSDRFIEDNLTGKVIQTIEADGHLIVDPEPCEEDFA